MRWDEASAVPNEAPARGGRAANGAVGSASAVGEKFGRLEGWKMIAAFVGRDERTAKRWEAARGLPVRRLPGENRSMVFAYAHELAAWRDSEHAEEAPSSSPEPAVAPEPAAAPVPVRTRLRRWPLAAGAALLGVAALGVAAPWRAAPAAIDPGGTRDAVAAGYYREGKLDWSLRTKGSLEAALGLFRAAVRRDPGYARAYVGLAQTYSLLREYGAMPEAEAYPKAEAAARRALAIAPDLAEAHAALAFVQFWWDWDRVSAEREFRAAIRLDPAQPTPHHWFATALQAELRLPEALAEIRRAQELDPSCAACVADEAGILLTAGALGDAGTMLRRLESVDPSLSSPHALLAQIAWSKGDVTGYLDEAAAAARLRGDAEEQSRIVDARTAFSSGGRAALLVQMASSLRRSFAGGQVGAYEVARGLAMAGEPGAALDMLDAALRAHDPGLMGAAAEMAFAPLRAKPRFVALLAAIRTEP